MKTNQFHSDMEQAHKTLFMIATLLSHVNAGETTPKVDKLRKHIRKGLHGLYLRDKSYYDRIAMSADEIWELVKNEVNDEHYTISLGVAIETLHELFRRVNTEKKVFYTDRTMRDAINSIRGKVDDYDDQVDIDENSMKLVGSFAEKLGFANDNKLKILKHKIMNNLILSGKKVITT